MNILDKAISLKQELDSLRPINKDAESRIMQKFRLDWNYHSNNLEGNSLTYGETKALILFGITAHGKPLKDHFEITGHDEAIKWVTEIVKQDRPITENFIRELHALILKEPYEVDAITPDGQPTKKKIKIGTYKTSPNHVLTKTGEIFRFASPEETPAMMHDLVDWYNKSIESNDVNPILLASTFHYRYIRIHPFDDGNGRTARILMNFILMRFGYPPVIIKTDDKLNYFAALRQADAGIIESFIAYIANNLNTSLELMIKGAKGESIDDPDDLYKEIALLEKKLNSVGQKIEITRNKEILDELFDLSVSKMIKFFVEKSELFEKFYVQSSFYIIISSLMYKRDKLNAVSATKAMFKEDIKNLGLRYKYERLNLDNAGIFDHTSDLWITFDYTDYTVKDNLNKVIIKKNYGEQLTEEEIKQLVDSAIRSHKDIIEKKIEDLNRQSQ